MTIIEPDTEYKKAVLNLMSNSFASEQTLHVAELETLSEIMASMSSAIWC